NGHPDCFHPLPSAADARGHKLRARHGRNPAADEKFRLYPKAGGGSSPPARADRHPAAGEAILFLVDRPRGGRSAAGHFPPRTLRRLDNVPLALHLPTPAPGTQPGPPLQKTECATPDTILRSASATPRREVRVDD